MKNNKIISILNLLTSIFYLLTFIVDFVNKRNISIAYLCLGVSFLCLSFEYRKHKADEE